MYKFVYDMIKFLTYFILSSVINYNLIEWNKDTSFVKILILKNDNCQCYNFKLIDAIDSCTLYMSNFNEKLIKIMLNSVYKLSQTHTAYIRIRTEING